MKIYLQIVQLRVRIDCETVPESRPQVGASGSVVLASQPSQTCDPERVVAGVKRKAVLPISSPVQPQAGATGEFDTANIGSDGVPSSQGVLNLIAYKYFQTVDPSKQEERNGFIQYMEDVRKVLFLDAQTGSLIITVECGSLEILDELWDDYCTGHLNEMAQKYLVTEDILMEFGLVEVKLSTTIQQEEYRAAREYFMQGSGE